MKQTTNFPYDVTIINDIQLESIQNEDLDKYSYKLTVPENILVDNIARR
jgi:hypothetical protein